MECRSWRPRAIALIAAYAVAVHALLAAFVPIESPRLVAETYFALCSHDGDGSAGAPVSQDRLCASLCPALAHGIATAFVPPSGIACLPHRAAGSAVAFVDGRRQAERAAIGQHNPRGPPTA